MNVNSLLEGSNPYRQYSAEAAKLSSKWEKSGLLEGTDMTESSKTNMAILLENQAKQLVNEASGTGTGTNITTANSEAWAGVALPLVRRVFGEIVAKDLLSVQPMNLPSGLIFYLDFQYGGADGTAQPGFDQNESLYGANTTLTKNVLPSDEPGGTRNQGLYGAGRFGYSINATQSVVAEVASGTAGYTTASATFQDILQLDSDFSSSYGTVSGGATGATSIVRILKVPTGLLLDLDEDGVRAYQPSATGIKGFFPQFTRVKDSHVEFVVSGANDAGLGNVTVQFQKGPDNLNDRGDFEEGKSGVSSFGASGNVSNMAIPEINVSLRSDTVTAKTRKLRAQWTPEFAQDLNAYHSIDAEAELTSILSEYISMEIDLELLDMLIRNADTTEVWSARIGVNPSISNGTITAGVDPTSTSREYYTKMSWFQTLGVKLQRVSNTIHQKTLRGGANFIVVSPTVSTILESIPGFAADSPGDQNKYAMGVQKIGAINSRYTVYKNPYMTENVILMGYKGNQFLETGAVFAPYIPLIMTPLVYDPASFTPRKGIMTRYAKKMVRPDFYGKILCSDLNFV